MSAHTSNHKECNTVQHIQNEKRKGIRHQDDDTEKVINDKREALKKFYQQVKQKIKWTIHAKEQYQNESVIKTHRKNWETFVFYLQRDVTGPQLQAVNILQKLGNDAEENINNIPHET